MSEEHKKPGLWQWLAALLIGLPVLYAASFGPACWFSSRTGRGEGIVLFAYGSVLPDFVMIGPRGTTYNTVRWYGEFFEDESRPVARHVLDRAMPRE